MVSQPTLPLRDAELADKYRQAAESAERNPFESPDACQRRSAYYREQAERIERGLG